MQDKKTIEEKLTSVKYNCANHSHLLPNQDECINCLEKTCTYICPAGVYSVNLKTKETIVQYENCLECGACRIACPKNAIDWHYPDSSCGVIFKNS